MRTFVKSVVMGLGIAIGMLVVGLVLLVSVSSWVVQEQRESTARATAAEAVLKARVDASLGEMWNRPTFGVPSGR